MFQKFLFSNSMGFVLAVLLLMPVISSAEPPAGNKSLAYQWLDITLEVSAREVDHTGARPTVLSREMAIAVTAMFDAWACYDDKAVGTCLGLSARRPLVERTLENKKKAISYAMYRVLLDLYRPDADFITAQMKALGYDPGDTSLDSATPQGIGNQAAAALIAFRHHDGANQLGDEIGCNGKPYSDYTFYKPVNTADKIIDPDRWQPIAFDDGKGGKITPGFLTPHWYRVKPFGLKRSDQFRPGPPPLVSSEQARSEALECVELNAKLTEGDKALIEFMRDGPRSTGQSGHWLKFAQAVSIRDTFDLDQDVKLFFAVGNTAFDAFIACWETKRFYDSSRPWTLIHHYLAGKDIQNWGGPGAGTVTKKGEEWRPYSPSTFITPPFPGYVSGHSTVSAACAKMLEYVTANDTFGQLEIRPCCILTEPSRVKSTTITLKMPTFTATAEMAGLSRILGGYHIRADNVEGLKLGRKVAEWDWGKIRAYFDGTVY